MAVRDTVSPSDLGEAREASLLEPVPVQRRKRCCSSRRCTWCLAGWLLLLACGGACLAFFLQRYVMYWVHSMSIVHGPDAPGYGLFMETYTFCNFTFFNITNPEEILQYGAKPKLQEVGPFVYKAYARRKEPIFNKDSDTVSYRQHNSLEFDPEETKNSGWQDTNITGIKITTLNFMFLATKVGAEKTVLHMIGNLLWKTDRERLFDVRSPEELISGYNETFRVLGLPFTVQFPGYNPNTPESRDPAYLHRSEISVGERDRESIFQYQSWEEQTEVRVPCPFCKMDLPGHEREANAWPCCGQQDPVPVWQEKLVPGVFDIDANAVHGSTGEHFRTWLFAAKEEVDMYFPLARRSFQLETTPGEYFESQGLPVRVFRPNFDATWANAGVRPANARYYQWGPAGLMNLTMVFGAAVFLSPAHFLDCDPALQDAVEGLHPDRSLHDFKVGVEPFTGMTAFLSAGLMLSASVTAEAARDGRGPLWFPSLWERPPLYVPLVWIGNQTPPLPGQVAWACRLLYMLKTAADVFKWVAIISGVVLVTLFLIYAHLRRKAGELNGPLRSYITSLP